MGSIPGPYYLSQNFLLRLPDGADLFVTFIKERNV